MRESFRRGMLVALAVLGTAASVHGQKSNTGGPTSADPHVLSASFGPPGMPRVLYAPSNGDDATFRANLAAAIGGVVDFFNASTGTPSAALLDQYDVVYTWANLAYSDAVLMGDRLAGYVDRGGRVILGAFCTYTSGNSLDGRIMDPAFSPVTSPLGTNLFLESAFGDGGRTCSHNCVDAYTAYYRDELVLQGLGEVDSSFADGEIAVAFRPDKRVWYFNGFTPLDITGDWPAMVRNIIDCGVYQRALVFDDTNNSTARLAAAEVGFAVRVETTGAAFSTQLLTGNYDVAIVESSLNFMPAAIPTAVNTFVANGGRAFLAFWDLDGDAHDPAISQGFRAAFDVSTATTFDMAMEVFPWISDHPHWRNPEFASGLTVDNQTLLDNGDRLVPVPGAYAVGGFVASQTLGQAAILVGNESRTIVNGFMFDNMDPVARVNVARNQMRFLFARSSVLVLESGANHELAARAAERNGLDTTVAISGAEFAVELERSDWDLVVVETPCCSLSSAAETAIVNYINDGGRVVLSYWDLDASATLRPAFGITTTTSISTPMMVRRWTAAHPIFNSPNPVGATIGLSGEDDFFDNGDRMGVAGGAQALAGFTASPTAGEAAIILANSGRTFANGFDYDSMDLCVTLDLIENQIAFLGGGGVPQFKRGDCNTDGNVDVSDPAFLLNFLFVSGPQPGCRDACDLNDDGGVDISDAAYALNYLFVIGSPVPPAPGTSCGVDPTADPLGCASYGACP